LAARKDLAKRSKPVLTSVRAIQKRIFSIRGERVMLDSDLAELYDVETRVLLQAMRRNRDRFPKDFTFQLNQAEYDDLRSQIEISKEGTAGGRRYRPYVFTEQGVAMLSSVLRSKQAVAVNIEIIRAFVELRHIAHDHEQLSRRVDELEKAVGAELGKTNAKVSAVFKMLREVTVSPKRKHPAGFAPAAERKKQKPK